MQPPTHPIVFSADDGRAIPLTGSSESSASDKDVVVHLKNPDDSDRRGSLIVSHPLQVVFKNLSYTVRVKQKGTKGKVDKPILKGCNGVFQPGRFCGILGASGAGKTTLLNLLAGQATVGRSEGSILVNGEPANASLMRKVSGFVFQDDVILETMTVREALTMSALLRLPPEMAREAKLARVTEIISVLHLEHASDTIVGSSTNKGISGGERKRAACGMEMIVNPGILFLDEPTSGLDTFTATAIVETLKGLAASGRTVAATLHQPSSEIFHMFDDLCLMASGRIMYFGPVEESVPYFAALGYPCPTYTNPADHFFMKILNTHRHTLPSGKQVEGTEAVPLASERIEGLLGEWPQSRLGAAMAHAVERPASGGVHEAQLQRRARLVTQFEVLTKRKRFPEPPHPARQVRPDAVHGAPVRAHLPARGDGPVLHTEPQRGHVLHSGEQRDERGDGRPLRLRRREDRLPEGALAGDVQHDGVLLVEDLRGGALPDPPTLALLAHHLLDDRVPEHGGEVLHLRRRRHPHDKLRLRPRHLHRGALPRARGRPRHRPRPHPPPHDLLRLLRQQRGHPRLLRLDQVHKPDEVWLRGAREERVRRPVPPHLRPRKGPLHAPARQAGVRPGGRRHHRPRHGERQHRDLGVSARPPLHLPRPPPLRLPLPRPRRPQEQALTPPRPPAPPRVPPLFPLVPQP